MRSTKVVKKKLVKKTFFYCFFQKPYNMQIINKKIFNKNNRLIFKRLQLNYLLIYILHYSKKAECKYSFRTH